MKRILIALYVISAALAGFIVSPFSPLGVPFFYTTSYGDDTGYEILDAHEMEPMELQPAVNYTLQPNSEETEEDNEGKLV